MTKSVSKKYNLPFWSLAILAAFPLYPYFVISVAIVLFCLLATIDFVLHKRSFKAILTQKQTIISIFGYYLFLIVYSFFVGSGLAELATFQSSLALLVLPIFFLLFSQRRISMRQYRSLFSIYLTALAVLCVRIFVVIIHESIVQQQKLYNIFRTVIQHLEFTDIHVVYLSWFILIGFFYLVLDFKKLKYKMLNLVLIVFFMGFMICLVSRIAILSAIVLGIVFIYKYLPFGLLQKALGSLAVLLSILILLLAMPRLQIQFKELLTTDAFALPYKKFPTSVQIRIGLYACAKEQLIQANFLGIGPKKFKENLNCCYDRYGNYDKLQYNSHNYYIYLVGAAGIFGLLLFLYSLFYQFRLAIRHDYPLYFVFVFTVFTFSLTENILYRSYGVCCFIFFSFVFLSSLQQHENSY